MAEETKIHTFDELLKHRNENDCWVLIYGKVYDVSNFLEEHPGGSDELLKASGKDASNDFEEIGHSRTAVEMMKKFYIGEIDKTSVSAGGHKPAMKMNNSVDQSAKQFKDNNMSFLLLALLFLGLAFALKFATKKGQPS